MLADQRCSLSDLPGRPVVNGSLAWISKVPPKLRVFHLLPKTTVMQVGVVKQRLRATYRSPGKATFLRGVVNLLCWQACNEVGK